VLATVVVPVCGTHRFCRNSSCSTESCWSQTLYSICAAPSEPGNYYLGSSGRLAAPDKTCDTARGKKK